MSKAARGSERRLQATFNRHGEVSEYLTQYLRSTVVLDQRLQTSVRFLGNSMHGELIQTGKEVHSYISPPNNIDIIIY